MNINRGVLWEEYDFGNSINIDIGQINDRYSSGYYHHIYLKNLFGTQITTNDDYEIGKNLLYKSITNPTAFRMRFNGPPSRPLRIEVMIRHTAADSWISVCDEVISPTNYNTNDITYSSMCYGSSNVTADTSVIAIYYEPTTTTDKSTPVYVPLTLYGNLPGNVIGYRRKKV